MILALNELLAQISMAIDAVEMELVGAVKGHGKRVGLFCLEMGRYFGFDDPRLFNFVCSAMLHDNALAEYILSESPGHEQYRNLKNHCHLGQENLEYLPMFEDHSNAILHHHERADGSGLFGLKEDEFSDEAACIALADQMDVRYHLGGCGADRLEELYDYLDQYEETLYTSRAVAAAKAVLNSELLERMSDGILADALKSEMPQIYKTLSNEDIIRLSYFAARIIDYKSSFTRKHTMQIANKSWLAAGFYNYAEDERTALYLAAALHDIGKLYIPTAILEKPGSLTEEEFTIIKSHVQYTWELLSEVEGFETVAAWASNHHEKLDGSGYPFGKGARELDFNSRLLACLDIYQAVSEERPYHPRRNHEDTMEILWSMAKQGKIDSKITGDLDQALASLTDGDAPFPVIRYI